MIMTSLQLFIIVKNQNISYKGDGEEFVPHCYFLYMFKKKTQFVDDDDDDGNL